MGVPLGRDDLMTRSWRLRLLLAAALVAVLILVLEPGPAAGGSTRHAWGQDRCIAATWPCPPQSRWLRSSGVVTTSTMTARPTPAAFAVKSMGSKVFAMMPNPSLASKSSTARRVADAASNRGR